MSSAWTSASLRRFKDPVHPVLSACFSLHHHCFTELSSVSRSFPRPRTSLLPMRHHGTHLRYYFIAFSRVFPLLLNGTAAVIVFPWEIRDSGAFRDHPFNPRTLTVCDYSSKYTACLIWGKDPYLLVGVGLRRFTWRRWILQSVCEQLHNRIVSETQREPHHSGNDRDVVTAYVMSRHSGRGDRERLFRLDQRTRSFSLQP